MAKPKAVSFSDPEAARAAFKLGPVRFRCAACGGIHLYNGRPSRGTARCLRACLGAPVVIPFTDLFLQAGVSGDRPQPFWLNWHPDFKRLSELRQKLQFLALEYAKSFEEDFIEPDVAWLLALEQPAATEAAMRERGRLLKKAASLLEAAGEDIASKGAELWAGIFRLKRLLEADPRPQPLPESVSWSDDRRMVLIAVGGRRYEFSGRKICNDVGLTVDEADQNVIRYGSGLEDLPRFYPDRLEVLLRVSGRSAVGPVRAVVVVEEYRRGQVIWLEEAGRDAEEAAAAAGVLAAAPCD